MFRLGLALLGIVSLVSCSKNEPDAASPPHKDEHHPPHGGTPVVLGEEAYHLELVRDAAAGRLEAYVLDGETENFIRVADPSFEVLATVGGEGRPLLFRPVSNVATGETSGDTSLFEAEAEWLKTTPNFDAILTRIDIRGTTFEHVTFNFPKGNDTN